MDLRVYFKKLRKLEAEMAEPYVVVVSRETADGGKAGVMTETHRELAAKLIVEDQATLATPEQAAEFHADAERRRSAVLDAPEAPAAARNAKQQNKRQ